MSPLLIARLTLGESLHALPLASTSALFNRFLPLTAVVEPLECDFSIWPNLDEVSRGISHVGTAPSPRRDFFV